MLERAALQARKPCTCLFGVAPDRGCRVSPCRAAHRRRRTRYGDGRTGAGRSPPAPQTRLCGPIPQPRTEVAAGRLLAATLLYGVRTFLDGLAPTAIARP